MKLPLYVRREEAVPVIAKERVPLPHVIALVSAGNPDALEAFVQEVQNAAQGRVVRVLRVSSGALAIDEGAMTATVEESTAGDFARELGPKPTIAIGAIVPALFRPALTLAFASGMQTSSFPAAAREVRDLIDGVFPVARPGLARNLFETSIFAR